jgi:para-nitrobenzyl esterase
MGGAPHATEIPYALDTVDFRKGLNLPEMIPEDAPVARLMHQYWVNFARTGDPNGAEVPSWPRSTSTTDSVQILNGEGAKHLVDPLKQRLDFAEQRAASQ